jgi:6-phosphogluconolactonase
LTFHPSRRFLYAVTETQAGSDSAFSIDPDSGNLTLLNTVPTDGAQPCDLEVDATGKMLVVVNYGTGSTAAYHIAANGSLSDISDFEQHEGSSVHARQQGPHAHSIDFTSDNRFAIVSDLGLDKVLTYEADPGSASLQPAATPSISLAPGAGPRHFALHPSERFAYSLGEIASTVTAMRFDVQTGTLEAIQTLSTLPEDFSGNNSTAEIEVHPSGKFLYASNRGHDSIAVFSIDQQTGELTRTAIISSGGERPRNFAIAPGGRHLLAANQGTGNVVVFQIDPESGGLTPTGREIAVDAAVCIKYLPQS